MFLSIGNNAGANLAAPLQDPHHGSVVFRSRSGDAALTLLDVYVAGLATEKSFVTFYFTRQFVERTMMQCKADAVR